MLKEILSTVGSRQRQFLLLRIVGLDKQAALGSLAVPEGTYNRWASQRKFQEIYRRVAELSTEYRDDALLMLREKNYALVVNLEQKMLETLLDEILKGKPVFAKTHLGREIYNKLASEMSVRPGNLSLTWEQLILQGDKQPQLKEGDTIEGEFKATGK